MSSANKRGKGLRGQKSNVFFAAREILRIARLLYPGMEFCFECTWFKEKHWRDWEFVSDTLGVEAVKLEAGVVAAAWRKRAFWASFPMLELLRRQVGPADVLEEGRRAAWRWRDKLPTVMASGPMSWNHKQCVETWSGSRWVKGSLRIGEVERIMGFGTNSTEGIYLEGVELSERQRWRALGNAIHASVMCHIMVSAMVTRGYVTRDSHLIQSQPWTVDLDGPETPGLDELLEQSRQLVQTVRPRKMMQGGGSTARALENGGSQRTRVAAQGKVVKVIQKKGKESESRRMMRWAKEVKNQEGVDDWGNLEWGSVYDKVDEKGVPQLQLMERKMGKDKPKLIEGVGLWTFIDTVAVDLMMLSRAESTWKQYAAWYMLFIDWGFIMGVDVEGCEISLEVLSRVLIRSLVMMWYGGGLCGIDNGNLHYCSGYTSS